MTNRSRAAPAAIALAVAITSLLLSGCLLRGQPAPISVFAPEPRVQAEPDWPEVDVAINIQRPSSDAMRDSYRILVRQSGGQLQSWPHAAWLDSVPDLIQVHLVRALGDSGRVSGGVGRPGEARADALVLTQIRNFEAVHGQDGALAVDLHLGVRLMRTRDGRQLAVTSFRVQRLVDGSGVEAVVRAFEQALGELIGQISGWTLEQADGASERLREIGHT